MEHLQHNRLHLVTEEVLRNYPIHATGIGILLRNNSDDTNAVVSVEESEDGVTYSAKVIHVATVATTQLSHTMVPKSTALISFTSDKEYVKLKLSSRIDEGVDADLFQFPPIPRELSETY